MPLGIGFVLLIASALASIWLSSRQQFAVSWVGHTLEVAVALTGPLRWVVAGRPAIWHATAARPSPAT